MKIYLGLGVGLLLVAVFAYPIVKLKTASMGQEKVHSTYVGDIPVIYIKPNKKNDKKKLVIWLDGFTGNKERTIPYLKELSKKGFTALSFDKFEHGKRGTETRSEIYERIQNGFNRNFWTILGRSSLDAVSIIDWAIPEFNLSEKVCMGGFSMGGDIAVSVAGRDKRVNCVAAVVASPDWIRPGRKDISTPAVTDKELKAEAEAEYFFNILNPMTHLESYSKTPAITFELGEQDTLIQSVWALKFQSKLEKTYQDTPERLRVVIHENTKHELSHKMWKNCLEWFETH